MSGEKMKRTIAFVIAILVVFLFTAGIALGESEKNKQTDGDLKISLVVSNGEKVTGKVIRVDKNRVFIRSKNKSGGGKNNFFFKANIAEIIPLADSGERYKTLNDAAKALAAGREFLKLNRPVLAEVAFNIAIQRNTKSCKVIGKIYTDADKKIPKEFKVPVPNSSEKLPEAPLRLFVLPTPKQIETCMEKANNWGREMKKIEPKTHTIETEHFIIYSAWSQRDDRKLMDIYEKLYRTLCKQFTIPKEHNIWIGKLPVFAFWKRHNFINFCTHVVDIPTSAANHAAGFMGQRGEYRFVVLGPVKHENISKAAAKSRFFELLVHESTHAFLSRYVSSKHVASWLNEGIAETITADLLPKSQAAQYLRKIHTNLKGIPNEKLMLFFEARNIPMGPVSYGAAQSLVRFLVKTGKKKFIKMVQEIKAGSTDAEALKSSYGMTYESLLSKWKRKIR